jgi:hypothetical protein
MKSPLGIALTLLAGCAVQPDRVAQQGEAQQGDAQQAEGPQTGGQQVGGERDAAQPSGDPRSEVLPALAPGGQPAVAEGAVAARRSGAEARGLELLVRGNPMCLGVEFLPPLAEDTAVAVPSRSVRAEAVAELPKPAPLPSEYTPFGGRESSNRHTWTMSADDLATIRNPMVRETLRFLDDIMGEDRRRILHDIGTPILAMQTLDLQSPGIDLRAEELRTEEETEWMAQHGVDLLRRPVQNLLRRTPLVRGLEVELDEFKEDNVPLSEAYGRAHDVTNLGRLSMRLNASDLKDPVEIAYLRSGLRIGSSQDQFKVRLSRPIADDVFLEVRAFQVYGGGKWGLRTDLRWALSPQTNLHFVAGDNMDFMATSSVYSLFESPMDGTPGLLVYAVHLF